MIRKANCKDASRIAEILIFVKRLNYRKIFNDDHGSFVDLQVYPLACEYANNPDSLKNLWVYEDDFVKGVLHAESGRIVELYVDHFFENEGIGSKLIDFAINELNCNYLWCLDKNAGAKRFYTRHGFHETGEKQLEPGTSEYIVRFERRN